ncbi:MAG TPA: sugar phosphate isomerase/epimerase [Planctomycetaceae bacterium]|nr:sugar phosphate isomerase/epimerase [Planctomycetaceae bacterium]
MYVAASTHCFADKPFAEACSQIVDLEFDKLELWLSETRGDLRPADVAAEPERFAGRYREATRLTPIAICLAESPSPDVLAGLSKWAKLLRVTQITIPASPLGTPFNTEIDQLREAVGITSGDGVRLSVKTETGHLTEDPHTAVELCRAVKGLGLTLDPSYYVAGPHRGQSYDLVFPHVYHVHLRDSTAEQVQVPTGLGEIDYSRLINQLHREGYNLALSVDLLPGHTDPELRPLEMRKLRMLLDTLL